MPSKFVVSFVVSSWALLGTGCLEELVVRCSDGRVCPENMACDEAHGGCVVPEQLSECARRADASDCSYAGVARGACYQHVCLPKGCGNGVKESGEACDDGNLLHGDGCSGDCRSSERCGNGVHDLSVGEACEPGASPQACRADCVPVRCGDGIVDVELFEQCDDGAANSSERDAACRPDCKPRRCGDGVVDSGELCDDGNRDSGDGCASTCDSDESCGNGVVDSAAGETCDHGGVSQAWCRPDCISASCGDGVLDRDAFEQCDDGPANSEAVDAACRPNCQPRRCGDGIVDTGEVCDDGNQVNRDGCSHDCLSLEQCRNGYRDVDTGEECDDGNALSHDGCSSSCGEERLEARNLTPSRYFSRGPMAYDAARNLIVRFSLDATWELEGSGWTERPTAAPFPKSTGRHALAWDARRQRTVLFGGMGYAGACLDDTWEWDGARWSERAPATTSPSQRCDVATAYDAARGRVVVFGGHDEEDLGDTWEWDGVDWKQLTPETAPPPGSHAMTYDPVKGEVVLFDDHDLWWLEDGTWRREATPSPLPDLVGESSLLFDTERRRLVLFYNASGTFEGQSYIGRSWDYDGGAWVEINTATPFTRVREPAVVYDPGRRSMVLDEGTYVWASNGSAWTRLPGPWTEPRLQPDPPVAYDALNANVLLLGTAPTGTTVPETWLWDGVLWKKQSVDPAPPALSGEALVYQSVSPGVLLVGGALTSELVTASWLWDGRAWREIQSEASPPARAYSFMAFDTRHQRVMLFGGDSQAGPDETLLADTWSFDRDGWHELLPMTEPEPRWSHRMTYDAARDRVVMWTGYESGVAETVAPVWEFSEGDWQEHWTDSRPPPHSNFSVGYGFAYDPNQRQSIMFNGEEFVGWAGLDWESLTPRNQITFLYDVSMVYENHRRRTLILGSPARAGTDMHSWALQWTDPAEADEACRFGFDVDGDDLIGCDDPDCWPFCTPLCPPGAECREDVPHCGDGICNEALETARMCPSDCALALVCGDFFCDAGETRDSCPGDCSSAD